MLTAAKLKQLVYQFLTAEEEEELRALKKKRKGKKKGSSEGLEISNLDYDSLVSRKKQSAPISKYADELEFDFPVYQKPKKKGAHRLLHL